MNDKTAPFLVKGGRLKEAQRPELTAVAYPIPDARIAPILEAVHRFDKAHLVMLGEVGLIERDELAQLLRVLQEFEQDPEGVTVARLRGGGGNHSGEKYMIARVGENIAGRIHAGRSSGDITATANRITQQRQLTRCMRLLLDMRGAVRDLARRDRDALMVGYSHMQHALPTTFGHHWVSVLAPLERDFARMLELYRRFDFSPAGAAVLTGSRFPLKPERTAELLGLGGTFVNSRDATWSFDCYIEAFSALSLLLHDCARLAEDLYLWCTSEFGLAQIPDGFCITSSILPQKRNPVALEHIRGVASVAMGRLASSLAAFRAVTDSVVIDRYMVTDELWRTFEDCAGVLRLFTALLRELTIDTERAKQAFKGSWFWASDLAAALVLDHGLAWRTAQLAASVLVRTVSDAGRTPESVTESDVVAAVRQHAGVDMALPAGFVDSVRNPASIVQSRIVPGGPAPEDLEAQIRLFESRMAEDAKAVDGIEQRHAAADAALDQAVADIVGR